MEQVLTPHNLTLLFQALTGYGCATISDRHYEIAKAMLRVAVMRLQQLIPGFTKQVVSAQLWPMVELLTLAPLLSSDSPYRKQSHISRDGEASWKQQQNQMKKLRRSILQKIREDEVIADQGKGEKG